jgi:hypothetical protein
MKERREKLRSVFGGVYYAALMPHALTGLNNFFPSASQENEQWPPRKGLPHRPSSVPGPR